MCLLEIIVCSVLMACSIQCIQLSAHWSILISNQVTSYAVKGCHIAAPDAICTCSEFTVHFIIVIAMATLFKTIRRH